jgi:S-adenosylmethionine:tRNA ribosyltransferase-isomerase
MHGETAIIGIPVIRDLLETPPDKLSVVGTTSVRSLESLYWLGLKIYKNPGLDPDNLWVDQWDAYETEPILEVGQSMKEILKYLKIRNLEQIQFVTKMIIVPGYQFRLVSRLITNFHQPSSTLLLLVSALIGSKWRDVYEYALAHNFRFLSYGDSSLLETQLFKHA